MTAPTQQYNNGSPPPRVDPFAGGVSNPSLSFDNAPIGTSYTCVVTDYPNLVQARDFTTKALAYYDDGNPRMTAVIDVTVNGQPYSVWAGKPSSLFVAIAEAQQRAGKSIEPGGTLVITYIGDVPSKKGAHLSPAKQYAAEYTPPSPFATGQPAPAAQAAPDWSKPAPAATQPMPGVGPAPVPLNMPAPVVTPNPAQPTAPSGPAPKPLPAAAYAALAAAGVDMAAFVVSA